MRQREKARRVREILSAVKQLAGEYYELTEKPLGVTGEVAEYVASKELGLELAPPRTEGYDAIRQTSDGPQRIQIKSRALEERANKGQRLGKIKPGAPCDAVLLVLLDNRTLEPREMWEASMASVEERLKVPGKSRARGVLGIGEFKRLASKVWPNV